VVGDIRERPISVYRHAAAPPKHFLPTAARPSAMASGTSARISSLIIQTRIHILVSLLIGICVVLTIGHRAVRVS